MTTELNVSELSVCSGVSVMEFSLIISKGISGGHIIILRVYAVEGLYMASFRFVSLQSHQRSKLNCPHLYSDVKKDTC